MNGLLQLAFRLGLALNAWLTRNPRLRAIEVRVLTPFFVRLTQWIRGRAAQPVERTPEQLGREWERLLGNRKYAHVLEIDEATGTVYGEITGLCPLRGSGDVAACHRLMAYDRGLMEPLGARFVVLASQAEPGRTACRIAMRAAEREHADLVPAHRLQERAKTAKTS